MSEATRQRCRHARRFWLRWALFFLAWSPAAVATDQPKIELLWTAPSPCPGTQDVLGKVEKILNRPLATAPTNHLLVRGVVTPPQQGRSWRVRLQTDAETGQAIRELEAASCAELADVTALFLAILIEPRGPQEEEEHKSDDPPPSAEEDREGVVSRAIWSVGMVSGVTRGLLPNWAFGFGLSGAVSYKALRVGLGVTLFTPVKKRLASDQGADFWMLNFPAELCWQHSFGWFTPALCGGARLARLQGKGFGPGVDGRARAISLFAVSAGTTLLFRYSKRGAFFVDADAVVPLDNRQFVFEGSDPALVFAPSAGATLLGGAQLSF